MVFTHDLISKQGAAVFLENSESLNSDAIRLKIYHPTVTIFLYFHPLLTENFMTANLNSCHEALT